MRCHLLISVFTKVGIVCGSEALDSRKTAAFDHPFEKRKVRYGSYYYRC